MKKRFDDLPVYKFIAYPLTRGPKYHFFGYYGIQPWSANGKYLLCLEVTFQDRPPQASDKAVIGMVELASKKFIPLAETYAWNFQQGAMLHWLPGASDSEIIFNERRENQFISVILNIHTGKSRKLCQAINALSHHGRYALGLNFARLHQRRPGYGYAGINDPFEKEVHPEKDGVYLIDLERNESRLIVNMNEVFNFLGRPKEMESCPMWFNHSLLPFNSNDSRLSFLVRYQPSSGPRKTSLFTADLEGKNLRCVLDSRKVFQVSHYDWHNKEEMLAWVNISREEGHYYLFPDKNNLDLRESMIIGKNLLTQDGHCSFSHNGNWILTDTYPDKNNLQTLKVFNLKENREVILDKFLSPPLFRGDIRCDLHPRWNHNDTEICFDSTHEGHRQVYTMDVSAIT